MRRVPQQHANSHVRRERDGRSLARQSLLLACCVVLAAGFVFAARQKIAAVQYGYRTEELRRERERLIEERQRLMVAVEEQSSPAKLEREAQRLGLQSARAAQIHTDEPPATDDDDADAQVAPSAGARATRRAADVKRPEAARPPGGARAGRRP